ncbi:peptide deformylase [Candidatus Palauibacter sp.]|uniref:peptide deformylase n=1 Tax=Candidatus Palauibacter sp. TaxID=3101350 RepID=UPI003AF28E8C
MILEIRMFGDPVLREKCAPVDGIDDDLRKLAADMQETMYEAEGIGLAAPQVGVPIRLFVYDVRDPDIPPGVLVNPEIVEAEGTVKEEEGCLSIPGLAEIVERSESIVARGLDLDGEPVEIRAEGMLSRCIQHEKDHLDGMLFLDRVSPLKRKILLGKWRKRDRD